MTYEGTVVNGIVTGSANCNNHGVSGGLVYDCRKTTEHRTSSRTSFVSAIAYVVSVYDHIFVLTQNHDSNLTVARTVGDGSAENYGWSSTMQLKQKAEDEQTLEVNATMLVSSNEQNIVKAMEQTNCHSRERGGNRQTKAKETVHMVVLA